MKRRTSGVLLHITSLPSPYGIGDLGPGAYRFIDFLNESGQGLWQILPLNPTLTARDNSPYSSPSAFAGNPLLISPERLARDGFLGKGDLNDRPSFPADRVDYGAVTRFKMRILKTAHRRSRSRLRKDNGYCRFTDENADWLDDFALFAAAKARLHGAAWSRWPAPLRDRHPAALRNWRETLHDRIETEKFVQYLFFKQWTALKDYARRRGIRFIGDIPIYPHYDSADVWAHPEIFKLDARKQPSVVAGIPPDYFSASGQLWNNPIYRWDVLRKTKYSWWIRRVAQNLKLTDLIRLDHFQGFVNYWEVPAGDKTAVHGTWARGPAKDLFRVLSKHFPNLPFIAEDLGVITPEVSGLRDRFKLPGMRVLQFAFGHDPLADLYKPENYIRNCVAYTGTHDNDTLIGWLYGRSDYSTRSKKEIQEERQNVLRYLGDKKINKRDMHWELIRPVVLSDADRVVFPMQDLLGLGSGARMNRPGTAEGNWQWRLMPQRITPRLISKLKALARRSHRG
jgi:4-alpha-glucanotransferase